MVAKIASTSGLRQRRDGSWVKTYSDGSVMTAPPQGSDDGGVMPRPAIVIAHPQWDERRREMMDRLEATLHPQCIAHDVPLIIHRHDHRESHLPGAIEAIQVGLASGATHITALPDDVILVPHFVEVLRNIIAARPDDILDLLSNHRDAPKIETPWYSSVDGNVMFGGTMRSEMWLHYLLWREAALLDPASVPIDTGLNLWAMTQGRTTYKPLPSLVQHDLSLGSLNGNAEQDTTLRTSQVWQPDVDLRGKDWSGEVTNIGRTFLGCHWRLVSDVRPTHWDLPAMYTAARHGELVVEPSVLILCPTYRMPSELMEKTRASVGAVRQYLAEAGIPSHYVELRGDALVCRMRQRGVNMFLQTDCSHLLWWDADIECLTPECVAKMLASGHDVISGAVPFKNTTGHVVCNLLPEAHAQGGFEILNGCLEVADAGSGFMLISRKALCALQMAHPELLHFSASPQDHGQPLWALFDTGVVDRVYRSEDYYFCHLWRGVGGRVYVYEPARFRHWGYHGFEGSLRKQYAAET